MGCTEVVVKYIFFLINFCIIVAGVIIIILGTIFISLSKSIGDFLDIDDILHDWILITAIGCIIFSIAFLGFSGSTGEQPFLLRTYGVMLLLITAVKIYIVVGIYRDMFDTESVLENRLYDAFEDPYQRKGFFIVEVFFQCCGPNGAASYKAAQLPIPPNCCPLIEFPPIRNMDDIHIVSKMIANYNGTQCTSAEAFEGCKTAALDTMFIYYLVTICMAFSVMMLELVAMFSAFYLAKHYKNSKKESTSGSTTCLQPWF
ncbi:unnamed protein product [Chilo suppressalis]|uniref:Tetraspanin n=1 Tax=Chilo suppressalis TaxID=168631 RepID=A0ABN8AW79_CHISP|nr:unnamed protein product [Chilo suppressalis]